MHLVQAHHPTDGLQSVEAERCQQEDAFLVADEDGTAGKFLLARLMVGRQLIHMADTIMGLKKRIYELEAHEMSV